MLQVSLECFRCAWNAAGAPGMLQVSLECCRWAWNAAGEPGMLQVRLDIIATTYRSTIVKTHVFRLYSHLWINVSMYRYSYPSTHGISALAAGGAWEQFEVHVKMTIQWTQIYYPGPWLSEFGDTLRGRDGVNFEMHCEIVIERGCRCIWRPWSGKLGGRNCGSLEIQLEAVMEQVSRQ